MRDVESTIREHKAYFDLEAGDFDAIEKDPAQVRDPIRRLIYRRLLKLHERNPRLLATLDIARARRETWADCRVLELGCGHGRYAIEFARMGARVTLVDYSAPMLAIARANLQKAGVADRATVVQSDIRTVDEPGPFDLVVMTGVTDYLPKATLDEVGTCISRTASDLIVISFPPYSLINLGRRVWLKLLKGLRLSYYTRREIAAFAHRHQLDVWTMREIRGYRVVGFLKRRDKPGGVVHGGPGGPV